MKTNQWLIWLILNLVWGLAIALVPCGTSEIMDIQFYILTVFTWSCSTLGCILIGLLTAKNHSNEASND